MNTSPRVTVIMRTRNSDWVVAQALASLFSQNFTDFSLMVVDSGSTDRTRDIVSHYPCDLTVIEATSYYPGAVLNAAIERASSDIVVFQNSDVAFLSPYSLERLVAAFDTPDTAAAFGRQIPRPDAWTWVRRDYAKSFPPAAPPPPWITLSLPNAAMRRSVWEEHPFYTDAWASEDTEWGHWARENNRRIEYVADAVVMHSHNYTLRQIYGRRFVEGEADAFIYRDNESILTCGAAYFRSLARDMAVSLRAGDIACALTSPARLAVYHWAHYRGHRLGARRLRHGDADAATGQSIVLSRYEP